MKKKLLLSTIAILGACFSVFSQTYVTQVKSPDNKKWGYLTSKGELVIPAQYEKCYAFSADGYAPIYDADAHTYYFINLKLVETK